ncbi:GAF domain-containing protein [Pseudaminobacter salicylatoxidans]|uniref:GAF domain-containing protein n=1 Tax=Pseudaminobacter salicylatoxidans TaxID=93369 RepID=UPI0002EEE4F7|nr:GAF domain-containing protein [Pseudaminobacter salicylatoxidans]
MFAMTALTHTTKPEFYAELCRQLNALLSHETDPIANAANMSALLFHAMPDVNWAGFYFLQTETELVLGPFQGKPACVRIAIGRGVCGTAAERGASVLVDDVQAFSDHIACDADSRSELVVPLIRAGGVFGVLDIDSPVAGRFDADDQAGVEALAAIYIAGSDWSE